MTLLIIFRLYPVIVGGWRAVAGRGRRVHATVAIGFPGIIPKATQVLDRPHLRFQPGGVATVGGQSVVARLAGQ